MLTSSVFRFDIPSNVQSFYNRIKTGKCTGGSVLKDGFYSKYDGSGTFAYCQDKATGVIYIHGNNQLFANMDVDCDGDQSDPGDGRCGSSCDTQDTTAFADTVKQYSQIAGNEVSDMNANDIPYVVMGNANDNNVPAYTTFDPKAYNIQPLSVMAVLCGNKLIYGVWGDVNDSDSDDPKPMLGEASISLATACFGTNITG
ncbi:hypothetical protein LTR85_011817 [Meristemomyces frigidus]|nr:hypothetical protein LTR85_011817 [Meristemomyces frigidus]